MTVGVSDGYLLFDLESAYQWVYTTFDPETYDDVRVEVSAENRGTNVNNVSLICRYDPAEGWYESILPTAVLKHLLRHGQTR